MAETVSKTKGAEAQTSKSVEPQAESKTLTDWRLLEKGGFIPVFIAHEGYKGNHPADLSCHSRIRLTGGDVERHMFSDHGLPVFKIKFRLSDGKKHPIWRELEELGIECADFYCPHCRQDIAWSPRAIIKHLNPHSGALRVNMEPQVLCMTLSKGRVEDGEFEGLYEAGE